MSRDLGRQFGCEARRGKDVAALAFVRLAQAGQFDEITLSENADMFVVWDENWTGKAGTIVRDDGMLFKSIHDIGAGHNTKPSITPSMWTWIGNPAEEWPEWIQPLGAHDSYAKGAKVNHGGFNWVSDVDGNVWQPGVYGWSRQS